MTLTHRGRVVAAFFLVALLVTPVYTLAWMAWTYLPAQAGQSIVVVGSIAGAVLTIIFRRFL